MEARFKGVTFEGSSSFAGRPIISVASGARVVIGDGAHFNSAPRANPLGCFQPCVLRALSPGAELVLGKAVGLSATVLCAAASIKIGDGTIFGAGAMVLDNDFHEPAEDCGWNDGPEVWRKIAKPVVIGRGVFVGARAIILKGVTIGDRAIIGAGAVVARDVPANHVAVGNPCRVLKPGVSVANGG